MATNRLGRAFYSPALGEAGRLPDLARFQFLDLAAREFYPDWELFAEMCVAIMRTEAGRDPHDRDLQNLVGELVLAYEELAITAEPGHILMIYTAEPGSPSAERLQILASRAPAPQTLPAPPA
ncbi:hypothetical protein [Nocardia rhamnosiphila]|uniref:MmyB family transcriptional regulator n=1 Tax=Nocardia rhamnosiphila TaxID=426716 RepID=UPI003F4D4C42